MANKIFGSIIQDKASSQSALDARYKSYSSIGAALADIPLTSRYIGLTVPIVENNILVEYWFQDGILDDNFVKKFIPTNEIDVRINNLVQQVQESIREKLAISYVQQLPSTGIQNVVYIVPNGSSESQNKFDEYIWTGSDYERLGAFGAITVNNYYDAGANINFNYNSSTNLTTINVKNDLYLENNSKKLLVGSLQSYLNSNLETTWAGRVSPEVCRKLDTGTETVGLTYIQNNIFNGITIFQHSIYDSSITSSSICFNSEDISTGSSQLGVIKVSGVDTDIQAATSFVSINDTYDFHTFDTAKVIFNEFRTDRLRPGFIIYDNNSSDGVANSYRSGFFYSSDAIQYINGNNDDEPNSGSRYMDIISVSPEMNEGDGAIIIFGNNNTINAGIDFRFKNGDSAINIAVHKQIFTQGNDTYTTYGGIINSDFGLTFGKKNNKKYVAIGDNYFYSGRIETRQINAIYSYDVNNYVPLLLKSGLISINLSNVSNEIQIQKDYANESISIKFDNYNISSFNAFSSNYYFQYNNDTSFKRFLLFGKKSNTGNIPIFLLSEDEHNVYLTPNATPYKVISTLSTNTGGYGITEDGIILYTDSGTFNNVDDFTGSDWASKKAFIRISPYNTNITPTSSININAKEIILGDEANAITPNGNSVKINTNTFELIYNDGAQDWIENYVKTDSGHIVLRRNRSVHASASDYVTSQAYVDIKTEANVYGSTVEESGEIFIKAGYGGNLSASPANIINPQTGSVLINKSGVRINYWKNANGNGDVYSQVYPDENAYGEFNTYGAKIGFIDSNGNNTSVICNSSGITLESRQVNIQLDDALLTELADILAHYSNIKAGNGWQ